MMRQCGECTLCCKLVPVGELDKPAGVRCQHVRWGKGCTIYAHRPDSCRHWACAWRSGADSADLSRPDRSHCVVDPIGMHITKRDDNTGRSEQAPVIQIWCDPDHPQAYLAPSILAFVRRRATSGLAAIIRYNNDDALLLVAPELTGAGWFRYYSGKTQLGRLADCTDVANLTMPARAAVLDSVSTGLPLLQDIAEKEGELAMRDLGHQVAAFSQLLDATFSGASNG